MRRPCSEGAWTQKCWNTGEARQIDFILTDEVRQDCMTDCRIATALDGKSDHRAVCAHFRFAAHVPTRKTRAKIQVGWKPQLDSNQPPSQYYSFLDQGLAKQKAGADPTPVVVEAATMAAETRSRGQVGTQNRAVKELLHKRKNELDQDRRKALSKQIWRALRRSRRQKFQSAVESLIEAGSGLHSLKHLIEKRDGMHRMTRLQSKDGEIKTDQADLCEVFACFYEDLYKDSETLAAVVQDAGAAVAPVTDNEVELALARMKTHKTGADDGLVAEMIKTGNQPLLRCIAHLFNDLLKGTTTPPATWRTTN
jgi:hypothetical protein